MATIYYYYAYIENNICVDVERTRTKKTDMTNYVEITADQYTACYDDDAESSDYIIGKMWDGYNWVDAPHHFYAVLNESQICRNVIESMLEIADADYVSITESDYSSRAVLGKKYNRVSGSFQDVDFPDGADTDTRHITVNGTSKNLQDLLDQIQAAIDDKTATGTQLTAADILAMLADVDGAGSSLDSDMLDGHDSSYFATAEQLQELGSQLPAGTCEYVCGYFLGDNNSNKAIDLGFRPKAVLLMSINGMMYNFNSGVLLGGLYVDGSPFGIGQSCGLTITDTGFKVHSYSDYVDTNAGGKVYIAFK